MRKFNKKIESHIHNIMYKLFTHHTLENNKRTIIVDNQNNFHMDEFGPAHYLINTKLVPKEYKSFFKCL